MSWRHHAIYLDEVCYTIRQEGEWSCQWSQQWERHEGHGGAECSVAGDGNVHTEGYHGELKQNAVSDMTEVFNANFVVIVGAVKTTSGSTQWR